MLQQRRPNAGILYNFIATENAQFLNLFELSGVYSKSRFIKARVFNKSFRVIKIDRVLVDYTQKLSTLFGQFRTIEVNYNQLTVTLKGRMTEQKAATLLATLQNWPSDWLLLGARLSN